MERDLNEDVFIAVFVGSVLYEHCARFVMERDLNEDVFIEVFCMSHCARFVM